MAAWLANLRTRSLPARVAVLGAAVFVVYALVAPAIGLLGGWAALAAAAVAAGSCAAGAAAALVASHCLRGPNSALPGMLRSMAARMGIPLAFGLACHLRGGLLADAGLLYYLLLFYPVTLVMVS